MKSDIDDYVEQEFEGNKRSVTWHLDNAKENDDYVDMESQPSTPGTTNEQTNGQIVDNDAMSDLDSSGRLSKKLIYIELASIVLVVIAGMRLRSASEEEANLMLFAFSVGLVSFLACLSMRAVERYRPGALSASRSIGDGRVSFTIEALIGALMIWWWLVGALTMTFKGPFVVASNGYFASWLGLFGSIMWAAPLLSKNAEQTFSDLKEQACCLAVIFASSIILAIASIEWLSSVEGVVGVACGVVSMMFVVVLWARKDKMDQKKIRSFATFLAIIWIGAFSLLTFVGPFLLAGNGLFACWAGAFFSIRYWRMEFGGETYV